jgi:hypothetical protein
MHYLGEERRANGGELGLFVKFGVVVDRSFHCLSQIATKGLDITHTLRIGYFQHDEESSPQCNLLDDEEYINLKNVIDISW